MTKKSLLVNFCKLIKIPTKFFSKFLFLDNKSFKMTLKLRLKVNKTKTAKIMVNKN